MKHPASAVLQRDVSTNSLYLKLKHNEFHVKPALCTEEHVKMFPEDV